MIRKDSIQDIQCLRVVMTGVMASLPIDLIIEILCRLPLESLSKCRWVSSSWYTLINHPRFTLTHMKLMQHKNSSHWVMFDDGFGNSYCMFDHKRVKRISPIVDKQDYTIVGSCYGLICLKPSPKSFESHRKRSLPYRICNPVTGDQTTLPSPPKHRDPDFVSGFGLDPVTNQYKVVRVIHKRCPLVRFEAQVFTIGSDFSWRFINKAPYFCTTARSRNVYVGGALHWLGYQEENPDDADTVIIAISFQLGTEKFGEITFPFKVELSSISTYFGVCGESLCVVNTPVPDKILGVLDVWLMEEYGVQKSWTKKYVIRQFVFFGHGYTIGGGICEVIKLMKNGEILLLYDQKHLGYYDPRRNSFRHIQIQKSDSFSNHTVQFVHVGNLNSPSKLFWSVTKLRL